MKKLFLMLLTGMALASCSEISTDPAPTRTTKSQVVTLNYSMNAPATATDTALVNPKLEVYIVTPTALGDGSVSYPQTATAPVATVTNFTAATQTITVGTIQVADGQPAPVVRLVFTSTNRPGRKSAASATPAAQRITTSLLVNGTARATTNYSGLDFSRTAALVAPATAFRKQTDLGVAIY